MSKFVLGVIGLALLAILGVGYAGYSAMNPHTVTITGQQYVTNTQLGTTTMTSVVTTDSYVTQTVTSNPLASSGAYQLNCGIGSYSYGCNWPYTYDACQGTGQGNNVVCDGYLRQGPNGCVELSVPTDTASQPPYDHYALQNLPSSYPPIGSWVVVKGQLSLVSSETLTSNMAACPANSIAVTSIAPTNPPASP